MMTSPVPMATQVGVHEAKTHLSRLADVGQEVEILHSGEAVARLVPARQLPVLQFGTDAGLFEVPENFDDPLPEEILRGFAG